MLLLLENRLCSPADFQFSDTLFPSSGMLMLSTHVPGQSFWSVVKHSVLIWDPYRKWTTGLRPVSVSLVGQRAYVRPHSPRRGYSLSNDD
jgi:hypothetical protein